MLTCVSLYEDWYIVQRWPKGGMLKRIWGLSPFITVADWGWLSHVQIFSPRNFAAAILLHFSLFHLATLTTRRLIYYPAMAKTRDAETHMGAVAIHYCGWLSHVQIFSPQNFAAAMLLHLSMFRLDILTSRRLISYQAMVKISRERKRRVELSTQ